MEEEKQETKVCTKCLIEKPKSKKFFNPRKTGKEGWNSYCKKCHKRQRLKRAEENQKNRDEIKEKICCRCEEKKSINEFYKSKYMKDGYYSSCKKCYEEYRKILLHENEKYRNNILKKQNEWLKEKKKNNLIFKLRKDISSYIWRALKRNKGGKDGGSVFQHLPYTIQQFKEHLESQFEDWMTWDNHGTYKINGPRVWHIDHIIPQSKLPFDSMSHPNFKKCWELENLQPMEAIKNIKKSDK